MKQLDTFTPKLKYRAPAAAPRSPELVAQLKKKARAKRVHQKATTLRTWTGKKGNGWEELRKLVEREKGLACLIAFLGTPSNDNVMIFASTGGKQYRNPGKAAVRRDRALRKRPKGENKADWKHGQRQKRITKYLATVGLPK